MAAVSASEVFALLGCLAGIAAITGAVLRASRRPPLIELMRWSGNVDAAARYDARMKAAGEAPVRNVRIRES
jgi:hypothetical protein